MTRFEQPTFSVDKRRDNVLIVDQSSYVIAQLYQLMQDDFSVHFASDERTAITMAADLQPDMVLMTCRSAAIDGFALCPLLNFPVVLLTPGIEVDDMVEAYESGAIDFLALPIPLSEELLNGGALSDKVAKTNAADDEANLHRGIEFNQRIKAHIQLQRKCRVPPEPEDTLSEEVQIVPVSESDKPKVLIVDDSVSNIQVLNQILSYDYQVFFATNGQQAIAMAIEERPDLIMLDVMMPSMNGYEVCEKLKQMQQTKDIGIVFVTALNEEKDEARGLRLGAIDYIPKPFSSDIVRARLHNHIELIRQRKVLDNLSMTDGLTGIPNRRQFDQAIERELHRAKRQKEPLSLIMVDIDNFKEYNDHYGHVHGDDCLKQVAAAIAACRVRNVDTVCRYGGEEFAVVLPNTNREGGLRFANKMREAIGDLAMVHEYNCNFGQVTASFGLYSVVPEQSMTVESVIKQADLCLYQAKAEGRDRVV